MVVDTLIAEPAGSPFRNFLASCVESFLRAAASPDRLFVARRGLLQHVVGLLLAPLGEMAPGAGTESTTVCLQYLFDLLAELVRFCPPALAMLDATLTENRFVYLLSIISSHLVWSRCDRREQRG